MVLALPAWGAQLPSRTDGRRYARARRTLAALGYTPKPLSDPGKCADGDTRCYPELEGCSGPGESGCRYVWIKGETAIEIATVKEPPLVSGVRCRTACE